MSCSMNKLDLGVGFSLSSSSEGWWCVCAVQSGVVLPLFPGWMLLVELNNNVSGLGALFGNKSSIPVHLHSIDVCCL